MVHIGGFFMGLKKNHRISNFLLHQIAYFCGQYIKKKPLKKLYFSGFHDFSFCKSGATRNRTGDTRIFSPLLYQLSYGTNLFWFAVAKVCNIFDCANFWEEKTQFKVLKVGFWIFNVNGRVEYAMKDEQKKGER